MRTESERFGKVPCGWLTNWVRRASIEPSEFDSRQKLTCHMRLANVCKESAIHT